MSRWIWHHGYCPLPKVHPNQEAIGQSDALNVLDKSLQGKRLGRLLSLYADAKREATSNYVSEYSNIFHLAHPHPHSFLSQLHQYKR